MKKSVSFLIVLFACFFLTQAFGFCMNCDCEKEYISQEQIVFSEEGIFIMVDGEVVPATYLAHDENGLYYAAKSTWQCPCGQINEWWRTKCKNCKR